MAEQSSMPVWGAMALAAITGVATFTAALASVWFRGRVERRERIAAETRVRRFEAYKKLVDLFRTGGGEISTQALGMDLVLYASDDVLRAWTAVLDMQIAAARGVATISQDEQTGRMMQLLAAVRRDAGRPDSTLSPTEVGAAIGLRSERNLKEMVALFGTPETKKRFLGDDGHSESGSGAG